MTLLLSKTTLKRKDFQEVVRLAWAQEVPGSNPGAPTKTSNEFSGLRDRYFTLNIFLEGAEAGGPRM